MTHRVLLLIVGICSLGLHACSPSSPPVRDDMLLLAIDKSNTEQLVRFFFGSYAGENGGSPFDAGILAAADGRFYVNVDSLQAAFPPAGERALDVDDDRRVDWDELKAFLERTYYDARNLPSRLETVQKRLTYRDTSRWFRVDVDGIMTNARRQIYISREAFAAALKGYRSSNERLLYPVGTTIVGEHHSGSRLVEVTGMKKRSDGFWDYFVYDSTGQLTSSTHTEPKQLDVPVQCAGCHFGSRLFEPEKSFPAQARPGPHGPRQIHVDERLRRPDVVRFFQEHRKRSDDVLGLYNTLFVARLLSRKSAGTLSATEADLLNVIDL